MNGAAEDFARPPDPEKIVTVLSVSESPDDHAALRLVFRHTNWVLLEASCCGDALARLRKQPVPVVICDACLPDGTWKDLLRYIAAQPEPPQLIVACRLADDRLWAEVLNLGGYNLLEKPFERSDLVHLISMAWLHWKHQRSSALALAAAG